MSFIPYSNSLKTSFHVLPVGSIIAYSGNNCPVGWKVCNGEELIVDDYKELFNIIGHTYGGSGIKFKLPNLIGRVIVGEDKNRIILSEPYSCVLGGVGGEIKHTLTEEELAKHKHTGKTSITGDRGSGADVNYSITDPDRGNPVIPRIETTESGSDAPHNNMQPYIIMNYIIKVDSIGKFQDNIVTYTDLNYESPVGSILPLASNTIPSGWLLCDGSSKLISELPELFNLIGYNWGGSGNYFNLPDLRGRTLVGSDLGAGRVTSNNSLSNTGGNETHSLTLDELPPHSHVFTKNSTLNSTIVPGETEEGLYEVTGSQNYSSNNAGSGFPHNNLQPYAVVNFIIKSSSLFEYSSYSFLNSNSTISSLLTYFIDASSSNLTITLSTQYQDGSKVTIRKIDSSINTISIVDQNNLNIELDSSYVISGSQPITILKTTNGWFITQL
jgi:microcystin-dependent protein